MQFALDRQSDLIAPMFPFASFAISIDNIVAKPHRDCFEPGLCCIVPSRTSSQNLRIPEVSPPLSLLSSPLPSLSSHLSLWYNVRGTLHITLSVFRSSDISLVLIGGFSAVVESSHRSHPSLYCFLIPNYEEWQENVESREQFDDVTH